LGVAGPESAVTEIGEASGRDQAGSTGPVMLGLPTYGRAHADGTGAPAEHEDAERGDPERRLASLRYVEIETSRRCNRRCSWCPNGHTLARDVQQLMPWQMLESVAAELGKAGFSGYLALHNYNEPLANPRLDRELRLLHDVVPKARLAIYTNGDLLKRDRLESLLAAGVKYVRVTRYPYRAHVVPTEGALEKWLAQSGLTGTPGWQIGPVRQGLAARWEDKEKGVLVEVIRPDVSTYNDRGGTATVPAPARLRTQPCDMTRTSLSIDYRGSVKMCCNVIPDSVPDHEQYVVGSVADTSVADLWNSDAMVEWRKLHADANWSHSSACSTCVQALPETRLLLLSASQIPLDDRTTRPFATEPAWGYLPGIASLHSAMMQLTRQGKSKLQGV
jgi:radical SAM protein with 4Fe4S-binding SPASM domain